MEAMGGESLGGKEAWAGEGGKERANSAHSAVAAGKEGTTLQGVPRRGRGPPGSGFGLSVVLEK